MKKQMQKFAVSMLAAFMILGTGIHGNILTVAAKESSQDAVTYSDNAVSPPSPWGALPSPNQYRYQKEELAAFCHFGPNTFEGVEWGENYGNREPSDIFRLQNDFDGDRIVKAMQDAGFKKLIITAKHHDGFCLWKSEYTEYDVEKAGYKNGEGDILAEISAACTKYDLDMGLYLSPWDVHEPSYGYYDKNGNPTTKEHDDKDYNVHYNNQLEEILSDDKYGNNGHFVEVWMDGAKGSGANAQEYDFDLWFDTIQKYEGKAAGYDDDCLLFGAGAHTTVRWIGNELGFANEETWSKSQADYVKNTLESNKTGANGTTIGIPTGNKWTVPEADSRITSGWFWTDDSKDYGNPDRKTPKTMEELSDMYFNSVGHNAVLLLNIPPNTEGTVDPEIFARMKEFGDNIRNSFAKNLAENAKVTASEVRGNDTAFSPDKVIDGDDATYWTMDDDSVTGSLTLDLGEVQKFDLVTIEEAIQLGQRIKSFRVEYKLGDGEWREFAQGSTIGAKRICRSEAVTADKIRIYITDSYAVPLISEVGVYKASKGFEIPSPIPEGMEKILISDTDISDGSGFTFSSGWQKAEGNQFIGGTGTWANSGETAALTFTGHKVWLFGTKDPGHGTADVYIDGEKAGSFDSGAETRATRQIIYESGDLDLGTHTLEIRTTGTVGLNAAAVLDNDKKGLIQFEEISCDMMEDSETEVIVKRVGGNSGEVSVDYENNPGSAIQGHYDIGIGGTLTFQDGETEKKIKVRTKRYLGYTGDLMFTLDLKNAQNAVLGFNDSLQVKIMDLEDPKWVDEAEEILKECRALNFELYTEKGREEVRKLTAQLNAYLKAGDLVQREELIKATRQLLAVKAGLTARNTYTAEDPFVFPVNGAVKTLEAELFILDDENAVLNSSGEKKYIRITERAEAGNGKEVNWFEEGNRMILPFTAEKAGAYKVTAVYRSGRAENNPNALEWSGTNIRTGSMDVYGVSGDTNGVQVQTKELEIEITNPGAGEWIFTASGKGGPVLDKFEIESMDKTDEPAAVTGVALEPLELTLTDSQKNAMLFASVLPEDAGNKNVTFTSSDPKIAEVTEDGLVISHQNGQAVITVTTEEGSKTAACTVRVQRRDLEAAALETILFNAQRILDEGQGYYSLRAWNCFLDKYKAAMDEKDTADVRRLKILADELQDALSDLNWIIVERGLLCPPANVKAVSTITGVSITFSTVANAASYEIYRQSGNTEAKKIAVVTTGSYTDENPPGGKKLTYTVVAEPFTSAYGRSVASAGASVTLPKAVAKLNAKAVSGGVRISFKKVKGAKKYMILRSSKKDGPYKKIKVLKAKQTNFIDKKAKKGKNYYKVVAWKRNVYSPAAKAKKVTVKK